MTKGKEFVQNDNNFAIAYYRFSSHSQNEESIDQQRQAAERYAEGKGFKIIKEYEDRAISGTTNERPGFQLMLHEIKELKPAGLIMWKIDRLSREKETLVLAKRAIRKAGCKIHLVAEMSPDDSPESALVEGLMESLAEFYVRQLRVNVNRGMRYNAENALYNGHKLLGYKKGEDKKYVINSDEAPIVKRIFDDYASGKPLAEISKELNQQGVTTALGRKFTINSLRGTLHNKAYIGVYKFSDIVIEGGMPVLVTQEVFDKVQERFAENKRKGTQRAKELSGDESPRYWLTGKLFCGECGSGMQGVSGTSHTGKKHYYYSCAEQRRHKCKKRPIKKDVIENLMVYVLADIFEDVESIASLAVDAAVYYKQYYADTGYIDGLKIEKKETEKALSNLMKAIEKGIFSETTQARLTELEKQKKALTETIKIEQIKKEMTEDKHSIQAYFDKYKKADVSNQEMREELLDYFIEKIYVYDDYFEITGRFTEGTHKVNWNEFKKNTFWVGFDSSAFRSVKNWPWTKV